MRRSIDRAPVSRRASAGWEHTLYNYYMLIYKKYPSRVSDFCLRLASGEKICVGCGTEEHTLDFCV